MRKFEYKTLYGDASESTLDYYGNNGWELVGISNNRYVTTYVLKREKQSTLNLSTGVVSPISKEPARSERPLREPSISSELNGKINKVLSGLSAYSYIDVDAMLAIPLTDKMTFTQMNLIPIRRIDGGRVVDLSDDERLILTGFIACDYVDWSSPVDGEYRMLSFSGNVFKSGVESLLPALCEVLHSRIEGVTYQ